MNSKSKRKTKQTNKALRAKYEAIYARGEENYFSKFEQGVDRSETNQRVLSCADWRDKSVVDVGCGTGELLRRIAAQGGSPLTGIDYSENAIEIARSRGPFENTRYIAGDLLEMEPEENDIVISCGTIEHSDNPRAFLDALTRWCRNDGLLLITCPHFINVRGFVWMALATLQDVPMSLTDLHFIHPWHMEEWCRDLGLRIRGFSTCDHERASGKLLPGDFRKRLRNALADAGIDNSNVPQYIDYLDKLVDYMRGEESCAMQGATAIYVIERAA